MMLHQMYHCENSYCKPYVRSSGVIMPVKMLMPYAPNTPANTEDNKRGNHCDECSYFWENKIVSRVYTHYLQRIYLLRYAHSTYLGGNIRANLSGKYQTHYRRREFQQKYLARSISDNKLWHPCTLDIQLHLYTYYCTDEKGYKQHNGY